MNQNEESFIMPEIIVPGPEGRLEGRYHHNKNEDSPIAIILHPHPEHGGNMNSKLVYLLFHIFVERGFSVLRFNFRGVGKSQGIFDNGDGELTDAATALDWIQSHNPGAKDVWMGGFSFGSWIGMQLMMRRPEISGFVSLGTPASMFDFSFLAPCPASGLLVHGAADTIIPQDSAEKLYRKLSHQKNISVEIQSIKNADHFFTDCLGDLNKVINTYLNKRLNV